MEEYYVHIEGKNYGPLSTDDLAKWAGEGRFGEDHYIWMARSNEWVRAGDVQLLSDALTKTETPEDSFYVRINEDTVGPMTLDDVIALIESREFNAMDFLWVEDEKRWIRAGEVAFLSQYFLKQIRKQVDKSKTSFEIEEMQRIETRAETEKKPIGSVWRMSKDAMSSEDDDRKYLETLVFMFVLHILVILSVNFVEVPAPEPEAFEVLKRVTKLVTEEAVEIPEDIAFEEIDTMEIDTDAVGDGGGGGGGGGGGAGGDDFNTTGVIGLLTAMGAGGTVADLLGSGGTDLDMALGGIGGLTYGDPTVGYGDGMGGGSGDGLGSGGGDGVAGLAGGSGSGGTGKKMSTKGRMSVRPPAIGGTASKHNLRSSAAIARIVNQRKAGIEYLYKKHLKTMPNMKGKVSVRFTIAANGAVTYASIASSDLGNPQLEAEIIARIRTWKFAPIDADAGDVTVVYPFVFFAA